MAQFPNPELEYMVEDYYDMTDFDEHSFDGDSESQRKGVDESVDSDFEDDFELTKPKTDTSALEARNGKDIQGIPWERLNFTRDKYRETRLHQYKNYENLSRSREELEKECKKVEGGHNFYDFQFNTRLVKSTIVHFQASIDIAVELGCCQHKFVASFEKDLRVIINSSQVRIHFNYITRPVFKQLHIFDATLWMRKHCEFSLVRNYYTHVDIVDESSKMMLTFTPKELRNLLWATSKHDVYLMQNYSVMHWSSLLRRGKEVLNVAKPIVPTLKYTGAMAQTLSRIQISTMAVKDNLLAAGGFQGELICKNLNQSGVAFSTKITADENSITNAVDICHSPTGSVRVITANNDAQVRVFDAGNFACLNSFCFPWSVNNTSVSPDGKLLVVLGDNVECLMADAQSGKVLGILKGHLDYSFASAWHPDGQILATGNQDTTCRLWDIRNLSECLSVLKGKMGAIRALRFTSDGRFMAMAEPADFVHIFDTKRDYAKAQEIDLFGEIAGISFSPDSEALFVGVADRTYGSLLEFNRRHYNCYLDSVL